MRRVITEDREDCYSIEEYGKIYSPDGKSTAYIVHIGYIPRDYYYVVKDGKKYSDIYDKITDLQFTSDGKLAFIGKRDGKYRVVINGKEGREYDYIKQLSYCNGKFIYIAEKGGRQTIVGKIRKYYEYIDKYSFSHNSFAYVVKENNKCILIKDGKGITGYEEIEELLYGPDGQDFAFVAKKSNGKYVAVRNGEESDEYVYIYIYRYSFRFYGNDLIFMAVKSNGKYVVVKNGEESKEYKEILCLDDYFMGIIEEKIYFKDL